MEISERTLREVFLPPWQAAISGSGALGVMATYPAIDGVPVHASSWILTEILRSELGFEGLVLSEGEGIETLVYEGLAPTQKEAGILALKAGVDVGISYEGGYMGPLVESVREGLIPEETIDRSVARILRQKMKLGLFEDRYVEVDRAVKVSNTATSRALALQAAREGVVLLKNEADLLPLRKDLRSIAVIGPNANHVRNQLGDYTSLEVLQDVVTILEGIRARVSEGTEIRFAKGCDVIGGDRNGFDEARAAAASADVAVVVVGENEWQAAGGKGTSGEGYDVANLDLTGLQQELVKMVHATGTPTVVVLVNGRPLSTRWIAGNVPAILESWCSGEEGGNAIADVLFGEINPSGRLPVTIPRHSGQLPVYYNHKKSKAFWIEHGWGNSYADMSPEPLWEFGFGLSYTEFKYSGLQLSSGEIGVGETVRISCDVENVGKRAGTEVVQLYVHDPIATVSTPVQELKGFSRVQLNPGEKKTVSFELLPEHLSLLDRQLRRVVEPGEFEVQIGHSSKDIRLRESFEVVAGK
jgi:beta-glucosidase